MFSFFSPLSAVSLAGVVGRLLEPIPAAYGQRQGTSLNESPAHCGAGGKVWYLAQGYLGSAVKVAPHLPGTSPAQPAHLPTFKPSTSHRSPLQTHLPPSQVFIYRPSMYRVLHRAVCNLPLHFTVRLYVYKQIHICIYIYK